MNLFGLQIKRTRRANDVLIENIREREAAIIQAHENRASLALNGRGMVGERLTVDKSSEPLTISGFQISAPSKPSESWKILWQSGKELDKLSVTQLLDYAIDASPEVSKAIWDFTRFVSYGAKAVGYQVGSSRGHPPAQKALDDFIALLDSYDDNGWRLAMVRSCMALTTCGALFIELVLNKEGTQPIDLVMPDPLSARFAKVDDETRGQINALHQWQGKELVRLKEETVQYVALDPKPNDPFGRPMIVSALYVALFLLRILYDIKRVIQTQGYPRLDATLNSEILLKWMPEQIKKGTPAQKELWVKDVIKQIEQKYQSLEADSMFVHMDSIKIESPVGTLSTTSLGMADRVISCLERMITRGLKSMSLFMGSVQSTSETQVKWEWFAYTFSISAIREIIGDTFGQLLKLGLQSQGIAADVVIEFGEILSPETPQVDEVSTEKQGDTVGR